MKTAALFLFLLTRISPAGAFPSESYKPSLLKAAQEERSHYSLSDRPSSFDSDHSSQYDSAAASPLREEDTSFLEQYFSDEPNPNTSSVADQETGATAASLDEMVPVGSIELTERPHACFSNKLSHEKTPLLAAVHTTAPPPSYDAQSDHATSDTVEDTERHYFPWSWCCP